MRPRPFMIVLLACAALGLLFTSFSTYDFVMHLDRQVHSLHCSFLPGIAAADASASGCKVTMMSPYSSLFRESIWGGLPITLPGVAIFAFLLFVGVELTLSRRQQDPRAVGLLLAASALPVLASVIMGAIAISLGAACKLCIAIYLASAFCLGGALPLWLQARKVARGELPPAARQPAKRARSPEGRSRHGTEPMWVRSLDGSEADKDAEPAVAEAPQEEAGAPPAAATPVSYRYLAGLCGIGVLFVALPVIAYLIAVPDYSSFVGACGRLARPKDRYRVMVPLGQQRGGPPAIEVLDPLCPACAAFEDRLEASGLDAKLDRRLLLFPLDNACNWMVDDAVHPGACTVSEAVLCAGGRADAVVRWAFSEHERIREQAARDPRAARRMVAARFPELVKCIGSSAVRSKLNKSLRWAVRNHLPVLTPQLYVDGRRLCDEDVDLGMDYALSRMLARQEGAGR